MGSVTRMDDHRAARAVGQFVPPNPAFAPINRTPELALIIALYAEMPRKYTGRALLKVMQMAERCPDCEASVEAGRIAALLAVVKGSDA